MEGTLSLPEPGSMLGGVYLVHGLLGQGAMGAVYEVERHGDLLAAKVLLADASNPTMVARFVKEGQATASLDSPHVVPVLDSGVDERLGLPYLIMPRLRGRDLEEQLKHGPLHPTVAARLIAQVASGLVAAHKAGVIHRDIKPANIFLEIIDGVVTARICDFGLAKLAEHHQAGLTRTGSAMGSPMYMAPEQMTNAKHVDAKADLWALGMSLYEALCGAPAYADANNMADLFIRVSSGQVPALQDAAPWVEPEMAQVVHGTLIRDREQRCPSAQALLDALLVLTGGSLTVTEAMLAPLSDEMKRHVAQRAAPQARWQGVVRASVRDPRLGQVVGGKFKLLKLLGRGGMGDVYEAVGPSGETVAVKVMAPSFTENAEGKRRFVRELRNAMAIQHPNVVRVIDAESDPAQGAPYMAMELLKGQDLSHLLKATGPLDPEVACQIFIEACKGLSAAHASSIVHRDIKPANIFLHEEPSGEVVVKICDFGIAKDIDVSDTQNTATDLTKTGGMLGTALYMSPEQARNAKRADLRTDIWSLCIALYETLCGHNPWSELGAMGEIIIAICTSDVPPLQGAAPWVEGPLALAVHQGLRRDPAERWASASELSAALSPFAGRSALRRESLVALSSERRSVVAAPASLPSREVGPSSVTGEPAPRRSGALIGLVAAVLVLGTGGFALTRSSSTPAAASSASPPSLVKGRVKVSPAAATVTMRGKPASLDDRGYLAVEAEPGDPVEITVALEGATKTVRVMLSRNGEPQPADIELSGPTVRPVEPAAASAVPAASAAPVAKAVGKAPAGPMSKPEAKAEAKAAAPPPAAPPAAPPPSKKLKEDL